MRISNSFRSFRSLRVGIYVGIMLLCIAAIAGAPLSLRQSHDEFPKRIGESFSARAAFGRELNGNIPGDRPILLQDLDYVLRIAHYLIDKRYHQIPRSTAARALGDFGHQHGIPALLAVVRDETDNPRLRVTAVIALSRIRDKRVVGYLIEALTDPVYSVAGAARSQLYKITGRERQPFAFDQEPTDPARLKYQKAWRQWWNDHRDDVNLDRDAAAGFTFP